MILKFLRWLFLKPAELPLMNDTFYGHECIFCKRDPDASYCIPKPGRKVGL
jgi:hypothetical protein